MNEPSDSRQERWRSRIKRIRANAKSGGLFAAGIVAAFLGLLLYNVLFPGPHVLNQTDVSNTVNSILASATPAPAFSETVYRIIRPSLVLIQAQTPGKDGKTEDDLGSGVIIDDAGDIMTSLHVVANASAIQVTFADGTQAVGQIAIQQPQNDIAVLQTNKLPTGGCRRRVGQSECHAGRRRSLCSGQPPWAVRIDERRGHLRLQSHF